jgi:hypothetical protein
LFKTEVIHRDGPWRGFEDVEMATLEWVAWFSQERLLAPLGYVPPAEFEAQYYDTHDTHTSVGVLNSTSLLKTRGGSFVRKIAGVRGFRERYILDPTLGKGEKVLYQRGIPGFHVVRYRVVQDGAYTTRERFEDNYPATSQLWKVGPKKDDDDGKDFKLASRKGNGAGAKMGEGELTEIKGDSHPEYVADEYLEVRHGLGIPSPGASAPEPGGGTAESRVAGKYGSYGWQVREGFQKSLDGKPEE